MESWTPFKIFSILQSHHLATFSQVWMTLVGIMSYNVEYIIIVHVCRLIPSNVIVLCAMLVKAPHP